MLDILRLVSIHHMLLFIFSETTGLSKKASFNTSHVTLYRNVQNSADSGEIVSIHHMLLFIKYYTRLEYHRFVFQYITCYSLSANIYRGVPEWLEFQYITCYSLSDCGRIASVYHLVSIHHMLLFIHGSNSTSCLI